VSDHTDTRTEHMGTAPGLTSTVTPRNGDMSADIPSAMALSLLIPASLPGLQALRAWQPQQERQRSYNTS
jgi:hypothetical protein